MKYTFIILFLVGILTSCGNQKQSHKKTVTTYYDAFDSGNFHDIKTLIHDSITIISGDYSTPYTHDSFYEFFKWDSIFKPSYDIVELAERNNNFFVTIAQRNTRNEFLKNNPLVFKIKVSFISEKISKLEEVEYIHVNWNEWNQKKDSLVNWIKINHPKLDGFVNDMTMKGSMDYVKAIELFEANEKD
jgi:hypothetical protein